MRINHYSCYYLLHKGFPAVKFSKYQCILYHISCENSSQNRKFCFHYFLVHSWNVLTCVFKYIFQGFMPKCEPKLASTLELLAILFHLKCLMHHIYYMPISVTFDLNIRI